MMHRNRSRGAGLAMLAVTAAFIASPVYAGTVAADPATATRIEMPASISAAHAVAVSGETTVPLAAHTSMSSANEGTATKSDVAAHLETASQPPLSMQHDASIGQSAEANQPLHSAVAMKAPSTAISNAETSLAAPPTAATTPTGPTVNAAHLEAAASQAPTTVRVASIDTSDASHFAHSPDISSSNDRQAPDRSGIKAETALPVSVGHTGAIATPPKSASKVIRTATVTAGARSKANSIRNRVWMRHPLN